MKIRLLHLVLVLAVSTVAASIGGVVATYWVIEDEVQDLLDDDLEAQSELLARVLSAEGGLVSTTELEDLIRPIFEPDQEETTWVNVYDPATGRRVSNLPNALPVLEAGTGPVELTFEGFRWLGYQHHVPGGPIVQLLHRRDRYQEVREEVLEGVAVPALAVSVINLLLLAGLTYLFIGPLTRLARDLEGREANSLVPMSVATPAREVAVLQDAVNKLMADVDQVLTREREFASDVAHELRTPLTTLKLELSSGSPDWQTLKAEVDRLVTLVNQLLTLARLQRAQWHEAFDAVDLQALYGAQIRAAGGRFAAAGMELQPDLAAVAVQGDPVLLQVLLGNLLDNAYRHCPAGTRADVILSASDDRVDLRVRDTGSGLPAARRSELNGGGVRMDRRSRGLGLGLTICQKIAEVHGAELSFLDRSDGAAGLEVRVTFPRLMSS